VTNRIKTFLEPQPPFCGRATGHASAASSVGLRSLILTLALALASPLFHQPVSGQGRTATDVAIIVNGHNPIENLTFEDLRNILLGRRTHWSPGRPISLIVLPSSDSIERRIVLRTVISMDEAAFRRYWLGRVFRAESASAPTNADSLDMIQRAVARIPGAIGVVSLATVGPDVKVVRIDGMLPGHPSFPLR
jgi:ABC-type phosphate transport system substrate-binding protein